LKVNECYRWSSESCLENRSCIGSKDQRQLGCSKEITQNTSTLGKWTTPKNKKLNYQLEQDEGTIIGDNNLKDYITNYYKNLFREPMHNDFSLQEERREDTIRE